MKGWRYVIKHDPRQNFNWDPTPKGKYVINNTALLFFFFLFLQNFGPLES